MANYLATLNACIFQFDDLDRTAQSSWPGNGLAREQ